MRVVTLLPAATEIVAAIGAGEDLVGISHECDYPPEIRDRPRITTTSVDPLAPGLVIDAAVRELYAAGKPVIAVDAGALEALAPDLIITQDLCEVCAVDQEQVRPFACGGTGAPSLLSLSARDLAGIWRDIRAVGHALGRADSANRLAAGLEDQITRWRQEGSTLRTRPKVLTIEWLDPLYLAGHWVPELVAAAGGMDVGAKPGDHSARRTWAEARVLQPDILLVALCGFDEDRAAWELAAVTDPDALALLQATPTYLIDGNAYTSRPGPRVVEAAGRIRSVVQGRAVPITRSSTHMV